MPWYTYPSIDFLKYRSYADKVVLEFGGGQSTLWWAERAKYVVTLEGKAPWYEKLRNTMPSNVALHCVSIAGRQANVEDVRQVLASSPFKHYDVVVVDGLYRESMVEIACEVLAEDGIVIFDNSESYTIGDSFISHGFERVDFYGNSPGVVRPQCTSIYFKRAAFVFDPAIPIHVIAEE